MKYSRLLSPVLALALIVSLLTGCGSGTGGSTWQDQYDLGMRYLSEGNYEEAIIAFTAAIELDPKRPEAFIGRGDAYVLSGETEDNLAAALADYQAALDLDETLVQAWLGLANVYTSWGDLEGALSILEEGFAATASDELKQAMEQLPLEGYPKTERKELSDGRYLISEYDQYGNLISEARYMADGTLYERNTMKYDERGWLVEDCNEDFEADSARQMSTKYYNEYRQLTQEVSNWGANDGDPHTSTVTYQYSGTSVQIEISIIHDSGGSAHGTLAFTMQSPDHYVEATGIGWSTASGEAHVSGLKEYRLEEFMTNSGRIVPWPEEVAEFIFDSDGNLMDFAADNN